jgi:hypothetical protein
MSAAANRIFDAEPAKSASTTSMAAKPRSQYSNFRQAFNSEPERKWQIEVQNKLLEYVNLSDGWNSYGAPPVTWDAGMFALNLLNDVMRPRTPIPQVVPTSVGGVQLEWHEKGIDLELHITAPFQCELWFQDLQTPGSPSLTIDLTNDFSALLKPIELLTQR